MVSDMELEFFRQRVIPAKDRLYRVAFWMLKDSDEAQDALQEGMLRLWIHRQKLLLCDNVEAFAIRTVCNLCLDRLKSKSYKGRQGLEGLRNSESPVASPHQQTESNNHHEVLKRLMLRLPEQQQWLLRLREVSYTGELYTDLDMKILNKKEEIPIVGYELQGQLGGGGTKMHLETISSNIYVRKE